MAHGGRRPNAGRKKGKPNYKTEAILVRAVREGITPAEVMQKAMEVHYRARRYDQAAAVAKDLAPYVHPRLAALQLSGGETPVALELVTEIVSATSHDHASDNGQPDPPAAHAPAAPGPG